MYGNYRHHYLSPSTASPASRSTSTGKPRSEQQVQHNAFAVGANSTFNGLPESGQSVGSPAESSNRSANRVNLSSFTLAQYQAKSTPMARQLTEKANHSSGNTRLSHHQSQSIDQQQQQSRSQIRSMSRDNCNNSASANNQSTVEHPYHNLDSTRHNRHGPSQQTHQQQQHQHHNNSYNNNNIYNHQPLSKNNQRRDYENGHQLNQDQYASQLQRKSNNQFSYPHHSHQMQIATNLTGSSAGNNYQMSRTSGDNRVHSSGNISPNAQLKSGAPHVNFNRAGQSTAADEDEDEGNSRKKKYLTAKYGQQQMNLIKKRLKIEMWLYEQLQELAKGSKSQAELDEIDVDLDLLLDMDDDDTRRHWLKKTLSPFDDLPKDQIDKFIGDVLEQAKLL